LDDRSISMQKALAKLLTRLLGRRPNRRPLNVLWICADDFAAYVSGTYGNPLARTPNLDRLASQGLRFDRAYCSCPLSTPSRMAFLTGRYPRSVGVTLSPTPLPEGEVTIGRLLGEAGYASVAIGKTHYYHPLRGEFDRCVDTAEFGRYLDAQPPEPISSDVRVLGPWRPFRDPASVWLNSECLPLAPDSEMSGTFLAGQAEEFLRQSHTKPFFLGVGFYEVHSPFRFPIEFAGGFDPSIFPVPEVTPEDLDLLPPVFRDLTDREKQGIIAAYYTSVAYMDRNVGLILDALDRSDHAEDTLVIYNSDHGYLLGQHGRFEKHCCYEEAVRAALVIRLPNVVAPGRASGALVELIDIVPTILELCGVAIPGNVQGRSLMPLLSGETEDHREHVIAEYADNAEAMVRTTRRKLIYSAGNRRRGDGYALDSTPLGHSTRLFDLLDDPSELRNVADLPENRGVVEALLSVLADHLRRTDHDPDTVPITGNLHLLLDQCLLPDDSRRSASRRG
jgi:choline-sulfatase